METSDQEFGFTFSESRLADQPHRIILSFVDTFMGWTVLDFVSSSEWAPNPIMFLAKIAYRLCFPI
jgi:hypothetical protein